MLLHVSGKSFIVYHVSWRPFMRFPFIMYPEYLYVDLLFLPKLSIWGFFCSSFSSHSRIFHLFGDVTIAGDGLQILTYVRHLWPLIKEGSLTCHTYCDIGHLVIVSSPRTCDTPNTERLAVELSIPVLKCQILRTNFGDTCKIFKGPRTWPWSLTNFFENFNLANYFWTVSAKALIFHMNITHDNTFQLVPLFFTLWPWPWSLTNFLKTLTLQLRSLRGYHYFYTMTLTLEFDPFFFENLNLDTLKHWVLELLYFTWIFPVIRPSRE